MSDEAKQINDERNQHIQTAVEKFGMDILKVNMDGIMDIEDENLRFKAFQSRCQTEIDQLEKDLQTDTKKEVITSGYIFDPITLARAAEWYEKKEIQDRLGDWWSPQSILFRVVVYGMLEAKFSARDSHVVRHGIGLVVESKYGKQIPQRTVNIKEDGFSDFNSSSRLGRDYYFGYYGGDGHYCRGYPAARLWKTYVDQKQQHCGAYAASPAYKTEMVFANVTPR